MMETMPNGNKNKGPLIVLNKVKDTKAVCESKMLLIGSISTYVAKDALRISFSLNVFLDPDQSIKDRQKLVFY